MILIMLFFTQRYLFSRENAHISVALKMCKACFNLINFEKFSQTNHANSPPGLTALISSCMKTKTCLPPQKTNLIKLFGFSIKSPESKLGNIYQTAILV